MPAYSGPEFYRADGATNCPAEHIINTEQDCRAAGAVHTNKGFSKVVCDNPHSFEALHALNGEANLMKIEEVRLGLADSANTGRGTALLGVLCRR